MLKHFSISLTLLLFVSACQTTDPTKGGFFGGVGGLASGNYQRGVDERKKKLENVQDQKIALRRESDRVKQQNAAMTADIQKAEAQIAALSRDLKALDKKIETARANSAINQTRVDQIEDELTDIGNELEAQKLTLDEQKKLTKIQQLKRRKEKLEEALATLAQ